MPLTQRQINMMCAPDWQPSVRLCVHGVQGIAMPDKDDTDVMYVMAFLGHMLMDDSEPHDAPVPDHRLMTLHMVGNVHLWHKIQEAWLNGRREGLECQTAINTRGELTPIDDTDWAEYRGTYGPTYGLDDDDNEEL
jgi:hypothetical protein